MEYELRDLFYAAMAAFGTAQGVTVAFPNVKFTPPTDDAAKMYVRAFALPTAPEVITTCGTARYRWLLQVSIYARDGIGELGPLALADTLRDTTFPVNSKLVGSTRSFEVLTPPNPAPPVQLQGWFSIPVSFTVETIG